MCSYSRCNSLPVMTGTILRPPAPPLSLSNPRTITFTVEEPHRMADRAKGECYVNRAHKVHELVTWCVTSRNDLQC